MPNTIKRPTTALRPQPPSLPEYIDQMFDNLRQEMIAVFPSMGLWEGGFSNGLVLAPTDIEDNGDAYLVRANLPGMRKENITIEVIGHELKIEAKEVGETEETDKNYLRRERTYRGFARTFDLPEDVLADRISARYTDGVLTVEVPKAHPAPAKRISVD